MLIYMSEIDDLRIIRKKYGEKMAHFCRDNFASLLEESGLLSGVFLEHFYESHLLYDDIVAQQKENEFKNYIYNLVDYKKRDIVLIEKTPEELMDEAGYVLKECNSEKEIQEYKKYYAMGEELCTFRGGRLDRCRVFFAVKKNVDEIKRDMFKTPRRQDEYGTSVISIQFTKDGTNTLSIKNRYNHTVINPDATFSNDLDNIVAGLTDSFLQHKGIVQKYAGNKGFILDNYVMANDGKYYKYNYEIYNVYYCPDNIIIDDFQVKKFDKSRYLVMDYYILDMARHSKELLLYTSDIGDSFVDTIEDISDIVIENNSVGKRVVISNDKEESFDILLNHNNQIVSLKINGVSEVGQFFMGVNDTLLEIEANQLVTVDNSFLLFDKVLKKASLPKLVSAGRDFLCRNENLETLSLPSLREVGNNFMYCNVELRELYVPNIRIVNAYFLSHNKKLHKLEAPYLTKAGWDFLRNNQVMEELSLPSLISMEDNFMKNNDSLVSLSIPKLEKTGIWTLGNNTTLEVFEAPELVSLGYSTLKKNKKIKVFNAPKLETIEFDALRDNKALHDRLVSQIEERNSGRGGRR